jgi:predicted RNase H-like nuclease (RuvC/YqgF family)
MKCIEYEPLFLAGDIALGDNFDDFVLKLKDAQFDGLGIAIPPEHVRPLLEALEARKRSEQNETDRDEENAELTDDLEEARSDLEEARANLAAALNELDELNETLKAVRAEADAEAANAYRNETECVDLRDEVEELKTALEAARRDLKKLSPA